MNVLPVRRLTPGPTTWKFRERERERSATVSL